MQLIKRKELLLDFNYERWLQNLNFANADHINTKKNILLNYKLIDLRQKDL